MNRHYARVVALQSLYESDFRGDENVREIFDRHLQNIDEDPENTDFAKDLVSKTRKEVSKIDESVEKYAPDWPIEQVAIIDRNILRMAICELLEFDTPPKVVINEAIELAKSFGSETSSKFVNGVLGSVYRNSDKYIEEKDEKNG